MPDIAKDLTLMDSDLLELVPKADRESCILRAMSGTYTNPVAYYPILKYAVKKNDKAIFEGIYKHAFGDSLVAQSIWANQNKCKIWEPCVYNKAIQYFGRNLFWVILGAASAKFTITGDLELDTQSELGRLLAKGEKPNNILNISWDPASTELNKDLGIGYVYPKSAGYWEAIKDIALSGQLNKLASNKALAFNADTQQMLHTFSADLSESLDIILSKMNNRFIFMVNVVKQFRSNKQSDKQILYLANEIIRPFKQIKLLPKMQEADTTNSTKMSYFYLIKVA